MDLHEALPDRAQQDDAQQIAWLVGRIDYERMLSVPYQTSEYRLDRMRDLLARLGDPQRRLPVVHVAGTKGKGSTSAMIAGMLTAAGLKTGLFTSPHLDRVEERLAIDGQPCPSTQFAVLLRQLRPIVDAMDAHVAQLPDEDGPTYFELTTALAWMHFVSSGADIAVIEVGMGGRLDSTNVCQPQLTVITSISLDHTRQLGSTLAQIAGEKAGIIKPGVPLVSGVRDAEPREVITDVARRHGAAVVQLGSDFDFGYRAAVANESAGAAATLDFWHDRPAALSTVHDQGLSEKWTLEDLKLAMPGRHQAANAAVALAAVGQLRQAGWPISDEAARRGLAATQCRARVELVSRRPDVLIDAAHNVASIEALLAVLDESFTGRRRRLIFGTSRDKDIRGMLALLLPVFDEIVLAKYTSNPRGASSEEMGAIAAELGGPECRTCVDSTAAWEVVSRNATENDLIVATGSFFLAAEIRRLALNESV